MGAKRILDLTQDDLYLSAKRGFLILSRDGSELTRVALDQLDAVIIHAHGLTYSNHAILKLLEHQCMVLLCGPNHAPAGFIWGTEGHHRQSARIDLQVDKTNRLKGRLWKQIIRAKIALQAATLLRFGKDHAEALSAMSRRVKSGDPDNLEAQAARRYWRALMGTEFNRDQQAGGINGLLNYGYTVIRALVARQIYASGFIPAIGLHHRNDYNPMRLADDLMEPLRPLVDCTVYELRSNDITNVCPDAKSTLGQLGHTRVLLESGETDLVNGVEQMLYSLVNIYETGNGKLIIPRFAFELTPS